MVNPFFVRVIVQAVSSLGKSIWKAYKGVIVDNIKKTAQNARSSNNGGSQQSNPFTDFINKTLQGANLVPHPLTREDALKILNIEATEETPLDPEEIMRKYYELFLKNNPVDGGSFYLQAKIFHSKEILMQDFKDQEPDLIKALDEELEIYKSESKDESASEKQAKPEKSKDSPKEKEEIKVEKPQENEEEKK